LRPHLNVHKEAPTAALSIRADWRILALAGNRLRAFFIDGQPHFEAAENLG
jgi:hypothetical protein